MFFLLFAKPAIHKSDLETFLLFLSSKDNGFSVLDTEANFQISAEELDGCGTHYSKRACVMCGQRYKCP